MSENCEKQPDVINSRVPLYFTYSVLATVLPLAILGTVLWMNLKADVRSKVSYYQLYQHDYDIQVLNPSLNLKIPPPIRPEAPVGFVEPRDLLKPARFTLKEQI
jgi:hypothetical protein